MIIAIGSNLPGENGATPLQNCERALRLVADLPAVSSLVRSRWYSSAPWPPSPQPRYVNGAARFAWASTPEDLLGTLQRIEQQSGRVRGAANAARTLDLDIVDMAGVLRARPDPILPHPRTHLRDFVLIPVRDVVPDWRHPELGLSADQLLSRLEPTDLHPE